MSIPPILRDLPEQILGERIVLRPFRAGDGDALWEATEESREHIGPWMVWVQHNRCADDSEEYALGASARWIMREAFGMGIWERETGRLLGQCLIVRPNWDISSFEAGYWLRQSALGQVHDRKREAGMRPGVRATGGATGAYPLRFP